MGKVSQRMAEGVKRRVEELNVAKITDSPIDRDTAQWLTQIDDTLAERLAKVGLIPKLKTAARMFDYDAATTLATKPVGTSTVSPGYVIHTPLAKKTYRPDFLDAV